MPAELFHYDDSKGLISEPELDLLGAQFFSLSLPLALTRSVSLSLLTKALQLLLLASQTDYRFES